MFHCDPSYEVRYGIYHLWYQGFFSKNKIKIKPILDTPDFWIRNVQLITAVCGMVGLFYFVALGIEPRASCLLGKCFTIELNPSSEHLSICCLLCLFLGEMSDCIFCPFFQWIVHFLTEFSVSFQLLDSPLSGVFFANTFPSPCLDVSLSYTLFL